MPIFDKMSLRMRVLTLACIPLLALVVTIVTTASLRSRADDAAAEARRSAEAAHLATELGAAFQIVSLEARSFLLGRSIEGGPALRDRLAELSPGLDRLTEFPRVGAEAAALKSDARLVADRLNEALATHVGVYKQGGVAMTVTSAGVAIEQFLQRAVSRYDGVEIYQIAIAILRMRRAGQQFATQKTPSLVAEFHESAAELAKVMPYAAMTPADLGALRKLATDYVAAFQQWVDASRNVGQSNDQLAQASQTLTAGLARLAAVANDNEKAANDRADSARAFLGRLEIWLTIIAVALTAGAALLLTRSISNALHAVRRSMTQIKNNERDVAIDGLDRKDEIGEMARALAVFRDHATERQAVVGARIAQAQQREELFAEREQRVASFENAFNGELENFQRAMRELSETANALAGLSANVSASARNATYAVSGASEDVTSVAIATEELSYSVGEVSSRTEDSRASAIAMADTIGSAAAIMERLNASANEIGDVIGLIQRVAVQTNLLSLNATIEAARAGEAGRGFAVVAQEVKGLASQTERATADVRALIDQLRAVAGEARQAFDTIAQSITAVVNNAVGIATAITQQKQGIDEINQNLQSASSRSRVGSDTMRELLDQAERAAQSAQLIQGVAESIGGGAASLNDEVGKFLGSVRAA